MAVTQTAIGLNKQDHQDRDWHIAMNSGFDECTARLTVTFAGEPNANVVGNWVGQKCWDSLHKVFWIFDGTVGQDTGWQREIPQGAILPVAQPAAGPIDITVDAPPFGYLWADGSSVAAGYTAPDLRKQFIIAADSAGGEYDHGDTGGAEAVNLDSANVPAVETSTTPTGPASQWLLVEPNTSGVLVSEDGHTHPNSHTHSLAATAASDHENRPPFYAAVVAVKI